MTLADLIARFRVEANDKAQPYFAADVDVTAWLNDAVSEACVRGRLIHESTDADITNIAVVANQSVCQLHPSVYEIDYIGFLATGDDCATPLYLISREDLDALNPDWRTDEGTPAYAVQSDRSIRLVPKAPTSGTVVLECFRLPKTKMASVTDIPEIHVEHHRHLIQWAMHKAYSVPDSEFFDKDRAAIALKNFTEYFGLRPDADLRRTARCDVPHRVEAFWV